MRMEQVHRKKQRENSLNELLYVKLKRYASSSEAIKGIRNLGRKGGREGGRQTLNKGEIRF